MARTRISLTTILGIEDPTMHHAPLTAQQRTQYLSARMHLQRLPAHVVLNRLRRFRLWYSAGAAMYPAKVPSVRQCVVTRAHGNYVVHRASCAESNPRYVWAYYYRQARRALR